MHKFVIPEEKKIRVIINTDAKNEVDDQFAIAHGLMTPSFDLKGIIPAHFGQKKSPTSLKDSHDEVVRVLELMGLEDDFIIADGAAKALEDEKTPQVSEGAKLIIQEAMKEDERPLYIAFLGPLTDMASALLMAPEISETNTKVIWIGGGAWPDGGWEYNLSNDVLAANILFKSTMELWQISRPVYRQMPVSFSELYERVQPYGPLGKYLAESVVTFNNRSVKRPTEFRILGDSPAIGVMLFPDCGQWSMEPAPVLDEDMNYIHTGDNRKIRVYQTMDARFILEDFYSKLGQFHRQTRKLNYPRQMSQIMADTVLADFPILDGRWAYDYGVLAKGMEAVWHKTKDHKYFNYMKHNMDRFIDADGLIKHYSKDEKNLDYINNGKTLMTIYGVTGDHNYKMAMDTLRDQLRTQPRTSEGGFWHKKIYPHQMWLDGIYMASPFYAEYGQKFDEPDVMDDVVKQLTLMYQHAKDPKTGLLYHGWDESRNERWADQGTGCSQNFWGRAMGWYMMALVDILDYLPENHSGRFEIIEILRNTVGALAMVQGRDNGLWYQVLDQAGAKGNYPEASASCMFTYAIAKAVRKAYIGDLYLVIAQKAMAGIIDNFVEINKDGQVTLRDTVYCSGLGNNPYRDGSYEYYISEPKEDNNLLGIGAFLQACVEIETIGA